MSCQSFTTGPHRAAAQLRRTRVRIVSTWSSTLATTPSRRGGQTRLWSSDGQVSVATAIPARVSNQSTRARAWAVYDRALRPSTLRLRRAGREPPVRALPTACTCPEGRSTPAQALPRAPRTLGGSRVPSRQLAPKGTAFLPCQVGHCADDRTGGRPAPPSVEPHHRRYAPPCSTSPMLDGHVSRACGPRGEHCATCTGRAARAGGRAPSRSPAFAWWATRGVLRM
jgi:hypothetical protein